MLSSPVTVVDELEVAFFQIPKVMHSTLGTIFSGMVEQGLRTRYIPLEEWEEYGDYRKFVIVRNPHDRLVSLYTNKNKNGDLLHTLGYGLDDGSIYEKPFEEFCKIICSVGDENADRHFRSQHLQVKDPDVVLKFEDPEEIEETLRSTFELFSFPMPHSNKSSRKADWRDYYNKTTFDMVSHRFKEDIEVFGYRP